MVCSPGSPSADLISTFHALNVPAGTVTSSGAADLRLLERSTFCLRTSKLRNVDGVALLERQRGDRADTAPAPSAKSVTAQVRGNRLLPGRPWPAVPGDFSAVERQLDLHRSLLDLARAHASASSCRARRRPTSSPCGVFTVSVTIERAPLPPSRYWSPPSSSIDHRGDRDGVAGRLRSTSGCAGSGIDDRRRVTALVSSTVFGSTVISFKPLGDVRAAGFLEARPRDASTETSRWPHTSPCCSRAAQSRALRPARRCIRPESCGRGGR